MPSPENLFTKALSSPVVLRPGCKVNLNLSIEGVHDDGYHELNSLFFPLAAPADILTISSSKKAGLHLACTLSSLQNDNNILYAAYKGWSERVGYHPALDIHLDKHIPMGAGLGGGSSDAAALLTWLNKVAGAHGLSPQELAGLAKDIGADVPFFLLNRPCRARGRGEVLEEVDLHLSAFHVLLLCPRVHIETSWAYHAWDEMVGRPGREKKSSRILTMHGLTVRQTSSRRHLVLYNDFEKIVFPVHPSLYELKLAMMSLGASGCVMSGSGASLLALFEKQQDREQACAYVTFFT